MMMMMTITLSIDAGAAGSAGAAGAVFSRFLLLGGHARSTTACGVAGRDTLSEPVSLNLSSLLVTNDLRNGVTLA